ncbi:MAG: branched-chain amino acid transporter permease [Betaproteobacteria bacterium]|nr:branched-chain amino acid transporter permease [Betaproteobacteria bacterium]
MTAGVLDKTKLAWWAVLAAALVAVPFLMGDFYINLLSQIFIAVIFAASLNMLVGYGGLTSLGHASYLGVAAYMSAWLFLKMGWSHLVIAPIAIIGTTLMACAFGWIALRATGLGFMMLTLALSQVLWGLAYRWVGVTDGDNGLRGLTRPAPFGIDLENTTAFYFFALIVTVVALAMISRFVHSPFGAALKGTRDQPRRMSALGHNVWMIRWLTFVYSGFWGAVAGVMFVYYNKYIHPTSMALTSSAEGLLGVIAGGSGTLAGPVVGAAIVVLLKNYVSGYVERWNMLLGFVFVFIVIFMPEGLVPGMHRLWNKLRARKAVRDSNTGGREKA